MQSSFHATYHIYTAASLTISKNQAITNQINPTFFLTGQQQQGSVDRLRASDRDTGLRGLGAHRGQRHRLHSGVHRKVRQQSLPY